MTAIIRIISSASADNLVEDSAHSFSSYEDALVFLQRGMDVINHSRILVQELQLHYPQAMAALEALDVNQQMEADEADEADDKSDAGSFVSANDDFMPTVTAPEFTQSVISSAPPNGLISNSTTGTNCPESPSSSSCENSIETACQDFQDDVQGSPSLWKRLVQLPDRALHRASTSLTFLTHNLEEQQSFPFSIIKKAVYGLVQKLHITSEPKEQESSIQASQETLKTCASTLDWSSPRNFIKKAFALLLSPLRLAKVSFSSKVHRTTEVSSNLEKTNPNFDVQSESILEGGRKFSFEFISISNAKSAGVNVASKVVQSGQHLISRFVPAMLAKPISRWIPLPTASAAHKPSHLQQGSSLTLKEETQPPVLSYAASSSISEGDSQIKAITETQIHPKHDSTENEKVQASVAKTDAQSCHLFPQDDELARRYFERRAYLNEKVGLVRRSYRRMKHIAICGYHIQELLQEYGIIETVCTMAFD